ncbi:MAG: S9 family peptidase [Acidobacteriota bacterium]
MFRLAAALSLCLVLQAAQAPITHEDVWLMPRVGAPAVSPDGKWAVVSVQEPSYEDTKQVSDLWIVLANGAAPPRRLTSTKGPENGLAWSPDSSRIAFVARREGDEAAQIYVLPLAGGEAVRVTSLSTGASDPQWRPDGQALLFQSNVYTGAGDDEANRKIIEERKKRKYNVRVYDSFPIRRWDRWIAETRPHLFVQSPEAGAKARDRLSGTKLASEPGFAGSGGGLSGEENLQAVWAPDGQSIVFVASINRNVEAYDFSSTHLYRMPASGGEPEPLTSGRDSFSQPAFRPDGKALYAVHSRRGDKRLYSLRRLAMLAWPPPAKPVILTSGFDRSVDSFACTPDSSTIYLAAEEHGHDKLFRMPAAGGEAKLAFPLSLGGYAGLVIPEKAPTPVLIANWSSMINPPEVVRIDPVAGNHRALTEFTAARSAKIDWQPPRHFWFTSKGGKKIHNMIVLPPAFDESRRYPLLVFMHGGPHNMWKDQFFIRWNYHFLASPGYAVLMTNYSGSTGFGEEFADAINRDALRGPANEINEAADEAIRRFPFIDAKRQAAGGASYGGYLANWMEGNTTRYRTIFNHAGLTNNVSMWGTTDGGYYWEKRFGLPPWEDGALWQDQNPFRYAKNFRTPMFVSHGENDFRVPLGQALEIYKLLQRLRVPCRLLVFPEENHWILKGENNRYLFQELFAWLKKYLEA